jgi:two-component sensor histidine kinase
MKNTHYLLICFLFVLNVSFFSQTDKTSESLDYAWDVRYSNTDTAKYILNGIISEGKNDRTAKNYAKAHSYIGVIEDIAGNSEKAVSHLLEAREVQEKYGFKKDLSFTYNNLGIAFFYQYNYDNALDYYFLSYNIDDELGDSLGVAGTLANIAIVYTYIDSLDRAMEIYEKVDSIYTLENDSTGRANVKLNKAKIEYANKNYQNAIKLYDNAYKLIRNSEDPEIILNTYHGKSNSFLKLGLIDSALYYCNLSNTYSLKYNLRERLQYGYDLLYEIYLENQDYELAIDALRNYTSLRDSLVNEDRNRSIVEMQEKYESERKDRLIAEIELEKITNEKERNFFIALSFIILLAVVLLGFAYRFNKRKNILLSERNKAVEENLQQKETMIGEIHHRIKNNLQLISSIFDLQSRTLKDEEAIKAIMDSKNRVKAMAVIHQKLYQQSDIYGINMREYIENLTTGIVETFSALKQKINVHTNVEEVVLHIDTSIPMGLIITEVITNSLKYAFQDGKEGNIYISLHERENKLILELNDDGVGMGNAKSIENSTSFGMKMIKSLSRQLRAEWRVENEGGTKYIFEIENFKRGEQK